MEENYVQATETIATLKSQLATVLPETESLKDQLNAQTGKCETLTAEKQQLSQALHSKEELLAQSSREAKEASQQGEERAKRYVRFRLLGTPLCTADAEPSHI